MNPLANIVYLISKEGQFLHKNDAIQKVVVTFFFIISEVIGKYAELNNIFARM